MIYINQTVYILFKFYCKVLSTQANINDPLQEQMTQRRGNAVIEEGKQDIIIIIMAS